MIYLYLFGTCFHFIYVFMIIRKKLTREHNETLIHILKIKIRRLSALQGL